MRDTTFDALNRIIKALAHYGGITSDLTVDIHATYAEVHGTPLLCGAPRMFAILRAKVNGERTITDNPDSFVVRVSDDGVHVAIYPYAPDNPVPPLDWRTIPINAMDNAKLAETIEWITGYRYEFDVVTMGPVE